MVKNQREVSVKGNALSLVVLAKGLLKKGCQALTKCREVAYDSNAMHESKNYLCTWCLDTDECTLWEMYSMSYLKENRLVFQARGRTCCIEKCSLCDTHIRSKTHPDRPVSMQT